MATGIRCREFADQRQIERCKYWPPRLFARSRTAAHLKGGIELIPTVRRTLEQGAVIGVVAIHFIARKHVGQVLALVARGAQDGLRQSLPGPKYRFRVEAAVERAVNTCEARLEQRPERLEQKVLGKMLVDAHQALASLYVHVRRSE